MSLAELCVLPKESSCSSVTDSAFVLTGIYPLVSVQALVLPLIVPHQSPGVPRVALYLIKDNATEFLRRFAVIVAEDAVVHPAYPALAWLLAAHGKGLLLRRPHVDLLLTMVQQARCCC